MSIPVIDVFAGPGGLGEGFCSLKDENGDSVFDITLSVELDENARETLLLRTFFRQFREDEVPEAYYKFMRKKDYVGVEKLKELLEEEDNQEALEKFAEAERIARKAELGKVEEEKLDNWIQEALIDEYGDIQDNWVLVGGPPCQAYSVVGRSRRQEKVLDAEKDERVDLYKQYLRILEAHQPAVFIMENVKGLLSAKSKSHSIFEKIMDDLQEAGYKVFSLVKRPRNDLFDKPEFEPEDFVIRCENYGIPQTRHRVIILGIREDFCDTQPSILEKKSPVAISKVIDDLPRLRSGLSRQKNIWDNWSSKVSEISLNGVMDALDSKVAKIVKGTVNDLRNPHKDDGKEFVKNRADYTPPEYETEWFYDERIGGICNHVSRGHMGSDLHRYLFASAFAKVKNRSPKLEDFPTELLPNHKNVKEAIKTKKFADRFRVQLKERPSKTITSHISKDGHYYIHYDPSQCRSLTVREAARIQTFPDNYFFCGPRTSQYIQVGNAVPPLLANKIAKIVKDLF